MRKFGTVLIVFGFLLILVSLLLSLYNMRQDDMAKEASGQALELLLDSEVFESRKTFEQQSRGEAQQIAEAEPEVKASEGDKLIPGYILNPDMAMPTKTIEGNDYVGVLDIPELALSLPVIGEWSYPNLKIAPCVYSGSAYKNDFVILAHNFASHFGQISKLSYGSQISFTDTEGNVFLYKLAAIEVLAPDATEEMVSGGWALTLFTCTLDSQSRVVVRCERA